MNDDVSRGAGSRKIVLGLIFVVCSGALGALLGGAYVRFFMPPAADGWTGIAQGLGGLMTGGVIAIVAASFLAVPLARRGTRALAIGAATSLGAAGLVFLALYLARPNRANQDARTGDDGVAWVAAHLSILSASRSAKTPIVLFDPP